MDISSFSSRIFSHTIKDRSQYPRKAYLGDTGFLYAMSGRTDMGRLLENTVYLELRRRLPLQQDIHYWRNQQGAEADFVIREGLRVTSILQASYSIEDDKTRKREIAGSGGLRQGIRLKERHYHHMGCRTNRGCFGIKVRFVPLWKWLTPGFGNLPGSRHQSDS